MSALLIGYARCSTDQQDLTAQRDALLSLGVEPERIYVDHGLTGTNRERPGLREALAACRAGDTLVVTKLDRLARSLPDARAIADELTARQISLSLVDRSTTLPMRWDGCCSSAGDGRRVRVRPDPTAHPRGHESRQGQRTPARQATENSTGARKRTWSRWYTAASTAPPRSPSCSTSDARPSTAPSSDNATRP